PKRDDLEIAVGQRSSIVFDSAIQFLLRLRVPALPLHIVNLLRPDFLAEVVIDQDHGQRPSILLAPFPNGVWPLLALDRLVPVLVGVAPGPDETEMPILEKFHQTIQSLIQLGDPPGKVCCFWFTLTAVGRSGEAPDAATAKRIVVEKFFMALPHLNF